MKVPTDIIPPSGVLAPTSRFNLKSVFVVFKESTSILSSYKELPKIICPFVVSVVEDKVKLSEALVPPTTDCPPKTPVDKFTLIVPEEFVKPVEKVRAPCLLLKVLQSEEDNKPLAEAEAVGKLKVCTDPKEEILKSVPELPILKV